MNEALEKTIVRKVNSVYVVKEKNIVQSIMKLIENKDSEKILEISAPEELKANFLKVFQPSK